MDEISYQFKVAKSLWDRFKIKCIRENISIKDKILELIRNYVEGK
jgi:hypothetical protein